MSGHSKWSQIKRQKGISDKKKGQVFSKLAKKISVVAKKGTDPAINYQLQSVINEARAVNMPKENIERAIKRATDKNATELKEVTIQAMGPGGIAIVVEAITDSSNRTIGEVRNIFNKNDVRVVLEHSLNWMFDAEKNPVAPVEASPETISKLDKVFDELDSNDDVENVYTNLK